MIYLLEVSIASLLFYLIFHFLFRKTTNHLFGRFYLLVTIALAFILPILQLPVFPEYINIIPKNAIANQNILPVENYFFTWQNVVWMVYIIGFGISLLFMIKSFAAIFRIISNGQKERCNNHTKVYTSDGTSLSSIMHFLLIPADQKDHITSYQLLHEESHIRQKHSWDIIGLELLKALLWFNPIMILYKKRMVELHEFLADQAVSNTLGKENYESYLIQQVSAKLQPKLIHLFHALLKKRIAMMNSIKPIHPWKFLLLLPFTILTLGLFSFETYPVYLEDFDLETIAQDTLPEIISKDTIITFDPATGLETQEVVIVRAGDEQAIKKVKRPRVGIDTVTFFDREFKKKTIIRVDNATGKVDTLLKEQ